MFIHSCYYSKNWSYLSFAIPCGFAETNIVFLWFPNSFCLIKHKIQTCLTLYIELPEHCIGLHWLATQKKTEHDSDPNSDTYVPIVSKHKYIHLQSWFQLNDVIWSLKDAYTTLKTVILVL